jgi:hypothetical protein
MMKENPKPICPALTEDSLMMSTQKPMRGEKERFCEQQQWLEACG